MISRTVDNFESADDAEQYAIDWQNWASEQSLSIGALSEWHTLFEALATKFDLTDVFQENGII